MFLVIQVLASHHCWKIVFPVSQPTSPLMQLKPVVFVLSRVDKENNYSSLIWSYLFCIWILSSYFPSVIFCLDYTTLVLSVVLQRMCFPDHSCCSSVGQEEAAFYSNVVLPPRHCIPAVAILQNEMQKFSYLSFWWYFYLCLSQQTEVFGGIVP